MSIRPLLTLLTSNALVALTFVAASGDTASAQSVLRQFPSQERALCKSMRASATRYVRDRLSVDGMSCNDMLLRSDSIAQARLSLASGFNDESMPQKCFLAGYREGIVASLAATLNSCLDSYEQATRSSMRLGYVACYLRTATTPSTSIPLDASGLASPLSTDSVVISTVSDPKWNAVTAAASDAGYKTGCLEGEHASLAGLALDAPSSPWAGQSHSDIAETVGVLFAQAHCGFRSPEPDVLASYSGTVDSLLFKERFTAGWNSTCPMHPLKADVSSPNLPIP